MKNLKSTLYVLLALCMVSVILTGCGSGKAEEKGSGESLAEYEKSEQEEPDFSLEEDPLDLSTTEGQAKNAMKTLGIWDGSVADSYAGGDGSEYNPFQIANGSQLAKLMSESNEYEIEDTYFVLTSDIVLNDLSGWDFENLENNIDTKWDDKWTFWEGIGRRQYFKGTFDGGGHTIYGLYGNSLFLNVDRGSISNTNIICSLLNSGEENVGGIAGFCRYSAIINNCSVAESIVLGDSARFIGGICGKWDNQGTISDCSVDGLIQVNKELWGYHAIGGIIGEASSTKIINCSNSASIKVDAETISTTPSSIYAGGICGIASSVVESCTNSGDLDLVYTSQQKNISSLSTGSINAGGIAGYLEVGNSGFLKCYNDGQINYNGNIQGIISTKNGEIDTSGLYDYLLCRGNRYMLVSQEKETVTNIAEYIGVLDENFEWIVSPSTDTYLNPNGKLRRMKLGYDDYKHRCEFVAQTTRYAGEDIFVVGQYTEGNYGASPSDQSVQAYVGDIAMMFHVESNSWEKIGSYSCAQSVWFTDGYYVAANDNWGKDCKTVLLVNSQTGATETNIYCHGPVWLGRYSEGLFFAYDAFYDVQGNRKIDLSEYAGLIKNQPYFQNGRCTLIAYNSNGTKYIGEIDIEGNFTSEFTQVG